LQDDEDACEWPTVHSSLEVALFSMIQNMKLKESSKRVAFKIPFQLADGFVIGIAGCVSFTVNISWNVDR